MANKYVNFNAPSPYASQQADLERRQRLAELMQQQAMQPIETNNTSITPTQGLAKVLQSYLSAKQLDKINTEQRNIEQSQVQEIDDATNAIAGRLTGRRPTPIPTGGTPEQLATANINAEDSSNKLVELIKTNAEQNAKPLTKEELQTPLEEVQTTGQYIKDPQDAMRIALTRSGGRALQANPALASMLSQYIPKEAKISDVNPKDFTTDSLARFRNSGIYADLVPAENVSSPSELDKAIKTLNSLDPNDPNRQNYVNYIKKLTTQTPGTTVNTGDRTGTAYGTEMAKALAAREIKAIEGGDSALVNLERGKNILRILTTNPITGQSAAERAAFNSALVLAGIGDANAKDATDELAKELANLTLSTVKTSGLGSGTGFSDKDLEMLDKASKGGENASFKLINRIAKLYITSQEQAIGVSNKARARARKNPDLAGMSDFGDIVIPPSVTPIGATLPSTIRPSKSH